MPRPRLLSDEERRVRKWAQVKRWRLNHPAKYQAQQTRKNVKRRGKPQAPGHVASVKRWCERNRERSLLIRRIVQNRRRARLCGAAGTFTLAQVLARFAFFGNRCVYCGMMAGLTIDHHIPLAMGGSNWPSNLRPACARCNASKGGRRLRP